MVKIRLKRMGSKYNAFYRIVAADARSPRDGKYIEDIGYYNPHTKEIKVKNDVKDKWLKEGAVPSETVKRLFAKMEKASKNKDGIIVLPIKPKKPKKQETEVKAEEAPKAEGAPNPETKAEDTKQAEESK